MNDLDKWIDDVVKNKVASDKEAALKIQKEAVGNTRQDMSRPVLEDLLSNGYTIVQWDSGNSTHSTCIELNNQQWTLQDFLTGLNHDAPIFERSHPGDLNCSVLIFGENLPTVRIDSYGNITEE